MKNAIYLFLLPVFLVSAQTDCLPVEGNWGDERIRSVVPARPVVYVNNDVLSIYLEEALTDLTVVVTNGYGAVVHQDCISSGQPHFTHVIVLGNRSEGEYTVTLSHRYGELTGKF